MITDIYIKPSKRKCSISDYKCFDVYDQDMKKINMPDCDVISIVFENVSFGSINMEIVDGKIHIWSYKKLDIEPLINTLLIKYNKEKYERPKEYSSTLIASPEGVKIIGGKKWNNF